jgi:hypothetical protein
MFFLMFWGCFWGGAPERTPEEEATCLLEGYAGEGQLIGYRAEMRSLCRTLDYEVARSLEACTAPIGARPLVIDSCELVGRSVVDHTFLLVTTLPDFRNACILDDSCYAFVSREKPDWWEFDARFEVIIRNIEDE